MEAKAIGNGILRAIGILVGVGLILFFLWKIQSVLVYFAIASVITLIARPVIRFFKFKLKLPNTISVVATILIFSGVIVGLIRMFIPLITEQGKNLSLLNFKQLENNYHQILTEINIHFLDGNIDTLENFKGLDISSKINEIPTLLNAVLSTIGSFSIGLFSILFISFFLMKDNKILHDVILVLAPKKHAKRFEHSFKIIKDLLSRYFIGLMFQITILFILYSITLSVFDVNNALVIAFLCALLNLIPYLGPLIGGVLILFLTMTSHIGEDFNTVILPKTLYVLVGYLFAQLIDNFFSQPVIFSKSVKSHPLEIFLIIIIGGLLFGAVGMVIAVPAYTALKVILKEFFADNDIVKSLTKNI